MLVVMQEGATEAQIDAVIDRLVNMGFTVHRSTGAVHTVLGGVGPIDRFDPADFEVLDGVKECHRIMSPYKLASRAFPAGRHDREGRECRDRRESRDRDGRSVQRRERGPDRAVGRVRREGRRDGHPRRRIQAPKLALQLPGNGRRRTEDAARRRRTGTGCW